MTGFRARFEARRLTAESPPGIEPAPSRGVAFAPPQIAVSEAARADYQFLAKAIDAARESRANQPAPRANFTVLAEKVGTVAAGLALIEKGAFGRGDLERLCVQVAAVALRLAAEGDAGFPASLPGIDPLDDFLAACTVRATGEETPARDLYDRYVGWCSARCVPALSVHGLMVALDRRGISRSENAKVYRGLRLQERA